MDSYFSLPDYVNPINVYVENCHACMYLARYVCNDWHEAARP